MKTDPAERLFWTYVCAITMYLPAHETLADGAIVSDVGSSKASVAKALAAVLPNATIIPAHPVAGTEKSGPDAGFAELFSHRWCILTPKEDAPQAAVSDLANFWEGLGAKAMVQGFGVVVAPRLYVDASAAVGIAQRKG